MSKHHETISISKSYHDTVEVYGRHFLKIVGVVLIPHVISYLLFTSLSASVISGFARLASASEFFTFSNINFDISLMLLLLIMVIQLLGLAALVYMVTHNERVTLLTAFEHALEFFWRYLVYGLALLVVSAIGLVIGYLIITIVSILFGFFSIELLNSAFIWMDTIVPFITTSLLSAFFVFAMFSIVDRNSTVNEAMRHSFHMVKGHYWPVCIRLAIVYVLVYLLGYVLQFIPGVGNLISALILVPFVVVYLHTLYRDLVSLNQ